jgi:hypothetical protein
VFVGNCLLDAMIIAAEAAAGSLASGGESAMPSPEDSHHQPHLHSYYFLLSLGMALKATTKSLGHDC